MSWQTLTAPNSKELYTSVVDAVSGKVLYRRSLVNSDTGTAWDYYPGADKGGVQRTRNFTSRGWLPNRSPWLAGNVAHVYTDVNDDNAAEPSEEITPSGNRRFVYPFVAFNSANPGCSTQFQCSWDPTVPNSWQTNRAQNGVQVFYFLGKFHDHLRRAPIGFTRAAGNFEAVDGDAVLAENMDGADTANGLPDGNHVDNANMATPPDGLNPEDADVPVPGSHQSRRSFPADQRRRRGRHRLPRVHPWPVQPASRRCDGKFDPRQFPGRLDGRGVERLVRDGFPEQRGIPGRHPSAWRGPYRPVRRRRARPDPHPTDGLPGRHHLDPLARARRARGPAATPTATSARSSASRRSMRTVRSGARRCGICATRIGSRSGRITGDQSHGTVAGQPLLPRHAQRDPAGRPGGRPGCEQLQDLEGLRRPRDGLVRRCRRR